MFGVKGYTSLNPGNVTTQELLAGLISPTATGDNNSGERQGKHCSGYLFVKLQTVFLSFPEATIAG